MVPSKDFIDHDSIDNVEATLSPALALSEISGKFIDSVLATCNGGVGVLLSSSECSTSSIGSSKKVDWSLGVLAKRKHGLVG